jgi:hypothetical protein
MRPLPTGSAAPAETAGIGSVDSRLLEWSTASSGGILAAGGWIRVASPTVAPWGRRTV